MPRKMAPRISLIYALLGLTWIGGSTLIVWIGSDTGPILAEVVKGASFILVTAGLLYGLIRRGEAELEQNNRQLSDARSIMGGVFEETQDLIAVWDRDKCIVAMNGKFAEETEALFGQRPKIGSHLTDFCAPSNAKFVEFSTALDRMLAGERFVQINHIAGPNGPRWYETSLSPLGHDGRPDLPWGGFFISRDTTDRILAETALRDREQRLQAIVDNLADYVVILEPNLVCSYYSAGVVRVTGFPKPSSLQDVVHPDDIASLRQAIQDCLNGGAPVRRHEYRRLHADGRWHHHLLNGGRLEQEGKTQFLAVIQNIDAQKKAEIRLAHSAKLASMGEFSAGLAHELAHPVAVIRLAAESALDHIGEDATPDSFLHEQIGLVDDQAKRMASMIEHIRAFSHAGDAPDTIFAPQTVIREVARMIRGQLDIDGISLLTNICDADLQVIGSPLRLEEVLLNLISNARSAIHARGSSATGGDAGEIIIACHCHDGTVEISVSDNGSGIPEVDRHKIFEPFFTTKQIGSGLGLGLAICQTITESMGGTITFESIPGRTTFCIRLISATP